MTEVINIMRHESVFNPAEYNYPVHIIGAGATGSRVFAALLELGMKQIHVYDYDDVESHNLANQIYTAADIGHSKVMGCTEFAKRKLGVEKLPEGYQFHRIRVTESFLSANLNMLGGIVFILTDTMASRKTIFESLERRCKNYSPDAPLLIIETRMASTHGSVFTINPFDKAACEAWKTTLVDDTDEDAIELSPCGTALSVGTTASLIANYAVWQMMHFFVDPVGMQPHIDLYFKPTLTITSPAIAA